MIIALIFSINEHPALAADLEPQHKICLAPLVFSDGELKKIIQVKTIELVESKLDRYHELEKILANADTYKSDKSNIASLSLEFGSLKILFDQYRIFEVLIFDFKANKNFLNDRELGALAKTEHEQLLGKIKAVTARLKGLTLPILLEDQTYALLEISSGGANGKAFETVQELMQMYINYGQALKIPVEVLETQEGQSLNNEPGFKKVVLLFPVSGAFGKLKFETGLHRFVKLRDSKKHTFTITVTVTPIFEVNPRAIDEKDLQWNFSSSGGPGGQNVNKTASRVQLKHIPSGITVTCQDFRSQLQNKNRALQILTSKLAEKDEADRAESQASIRKKMLADGVIVRDFREDSQRVTDKRITIMDPEFAAQYKDIMQGSTTFAWMVEQAREFSLAGDLP